MKSVYTERYQRFLALLIATRKAKGLAQAVIAERLGRPQSFVSKYESGERRLDVAEFLSVSEAMEVDPIALFRKFVHGTQSAGERRRARQRT